MKSDSEYVKDRYWKYGSGFGLSDIVILNDKNFKNDTIFFNKKAVAIFIKLDDFRTDLIIQSIDNKYFGTYHDQNQIIRKK